MQVCKQIYKSISDCYHYIKTLIRLWPENAENNLDWRMVEPFTWYGLC